MRTTALAAVAAAVAIAGCSQETPQDEMAREAKVKVKGSEQLQLHQLDALNLAIALKRAIYDSGYRCERIDKEGYVGEYKNLDTWTAHCTDGRDWAVYVGPDGSAQVRDCVDVAKFGLPKCEIHETPKGSLATLDAGNQVETGNKVEKSG